MPKSSFTKNNVVFDFSKIGGPEEDRTLDLTDANRTLSQLSYGPKQHIDYKPMLSKSQLLFFDFSEK